MYIYAMPSVKNSTSRELSRAALAMNAYPKRRHNIERRKGHKPAEFKISMFFFFFSFF
jgi:hypothetical protein